MVSETWLNIIGISLGLLSYLLLYLGKGIQKWAIEGFKDVINEKEIKKSAKTKKQGKNSLVWIIGTILTTGFMFLQWVPLSPPFNIEPNKIAPLEGFGLIVLLIFSYFVLKEKINKIEIAGACLIIVGIVLINLVVTNSSTPTLEEINFTSFWVSFGVIFVIEILGILVLLLIVKNQRWSGILIAVFAGTCMAWQTISKTMSGIDGIRLIFTFVVFIFGITTLALTQWAFTKIQANLVVPLFTSTSILLTAILGFFIMGDQIGPIQIVGIGIIIIGVVLISAFEKPTDLKDGIEISS